MASTGLYGVTLTAVLPVGIVALWVTMAVTVSAESGEAERLQRQVQYLSRALAESRAEADALKMRLAERQEEDRRSVLRQSDEMAVLDVNSELGMLIINAGRRDGIQPGMLFAVLRDGRKIAGVRVVDVRNRLAGAVVESRDWDKVPRKGDRVLLEGSRE